MQLDADAGQCGPDLPSQPDRTWRVPVHTQRLRREAQDRAVDSATSPVCARRTARATTTSGSCRTAPGSDLGTSAPAGPKARSTNASGTARPPSESANDEPAAHSIGRSSAVAARPTAAPCAGCVEQAA